MRLHDELVATLRAGMEEKGLTQYRLAQLSGVPQPNLSQILSGKHATEATWQRLFDVTHPEPEPEPEAPKRHPLDVTPDTP